MPPSLSMPTGGSSLQNQSLSDHKPTLLGIPQELHNRIVSAYSFHIPEVRAYLADFHQFGYLYTTAGTVAKSIDLDLSSKRTRCIPGVCELTAYFYYLPSEVHPPTKTPQLICKQLRAELGKMHLAAFRNYWTANTFRVELCDQSFGGSDHIAEEHLRHIHHIAYNPKRLPDHLTLHFVFRESWGLSIELAEELYPGGLMVPVNDLEDYRRFAKLEELARLPEVLEARYRASDKGPLNPRIGQGFTFNELVVFLEVLDDVGNVFDDLPRYCATSSL